jgi:ssDNA-binding Zn-finger/Zn-ribbon topoisomerase 1
MHNIRSKLQRLVCSNCRSRRFDAWVAGEGGRQLIDADRARICPRCDLLRLLPEIDARPMAPLCPVCVEEMKAEGERPEAWPMPPAGSEKCPRCGKPTIVREPRDAPGAYFLGCTGFPSCMWRRDM